MSISYFELLISFSVRHVNQMKPECLRSVLYLNSFNLKLSLFEVSDNDLGLHCQTLFFLQRHMLTVIAIDNKLRVVFVLQCLLQISFNSSLLQLDIIKELLPLFRIIGNPSLFQLLLNESHLLGLNNLPLVLGP